MIKVLDIGCGDGSHAEWFKDRGELFVTRLDADASVAPDIVWNIINPLPDNLVGKFDIVIASHVLEHIRYRQVPDAARNIISAVNEDGEVWVLVPDFVWAFQQFIAGNETKGLMGTIWGGQADDWDYHYCGFSMNSLATVMYNGGCKQVRAKQESIEIVIDGKHYPVKQITAMGTLKVKDYGK